MRLGVALVGALVFCSAAFAEPYEVAYYPPGSPYAQGLDLGGPFPDDQGWVRYFGPEEIVTRSVQEGVFILQAEENGDWETYAAEMDNTLNPEPGELLYIEWRMIVDDENVFGDTIMGVALDNFGGVLCLSTGVDHVRDLEGFEWYDYTAGVFHTFLVVSANLVDYDLFVDGEYAFSDVFKLPTSLNSFVDWGDGTTTYSSSRWEYVRFGAARLGDIRIDGRVDLMDFATFAMCYSPGSTEPPPGCSDQEFALCDLDDDADVDLTDFATFALNYTGAQ